MTVFLNPVATVAPALGDRTPRSRGVSQGAGEGKRGRLGVPVPGH